MEVTFVVVMVIIFLFRNKAKSFAILVRVVDPVLFLFDIMQLLKN